MKIAIQYTFMFSSYALNKFILLLRKGTFYPCECMDECKSLIKHHFFYSNLNIEDITDSDYNHTKRVSKDFEIKKLG